MLLMTDTQMAANDVPKPITFEEMKGKLINNLSNLYNAFVTQLGTIPCSHALQSHAMRHFDDGFLSFREGVATLQMPAPQPVPPTEPEAAPVEQMTEEQPVEPTAPAA
jgi:hypothetical protein